MKSKALLALLALCLICFPAKAAESPGHVCFYAVDSDRDGRVSPEEFKRVYGKDSQARFDVADTDGDGFLVHDEYHESVGGGAGEGEGDGPDDQGLSQEGKARNS